MLHSPGETSPHLLYDQDGPIGIVTFNRPEARNAMTPEMCDALVDQCDRVERDAAVRVLILRGAGDKAFVAGTDIGHLKDLFDTPASADAYEQHLDAMYDRLEALSLPTIAAIDGVATGGGCIVAAACDLRVCTTRARLGVPIARTVGNCLSATHYARFLDLIGPGRLKEMIFTGRLFNADEALAIGLVNRVVSPEALDETVRDLAQVVASHAPLTIKATKEIVRRILAERRLAAESVHDLVSQCYTSDDFREGIDAFLTKRPPRWTGH